METTKKQCPYWHKRTWDDGYWYCQKVAGHKEDHEGAWGFTGSRWEWILIDEIEETKEEREEE